MVSELWRKFRPPQLQNCLIDFDEIQTSEVRTIPPEDQPPYKISFQLMTWVVWPKTISGVHVSPGSAQTLVRRGGLTNHHSIPYSQQHLWCQKLPKSVYVHWSYNEQRRCCFLRHSTFTEWSSRLEEKRSCTLMVTVDIWSCVMGSNCYKSLQVVKWHQQYC